MLNRTTSMRRLHGPRGALLVLLAGGALALHDQISVLLAIMAGLVLIDIAVPEHGHRRAQADDRFRRAVRRRGAAQRRAALLGRPPSRLELLDDGAGWAASAQRRSLGVEQIALDSIAGTVDAGKARLFDGRFRPGWHAHGRWQAVWLARANGLELPPISVYRVGERHFVRDGHHRVSVARDLGRPAIEADVVELRAPGRT
jgi:hypothetical protein